MFKNLSWKFAVRRALEVFLGALLGGGGMYLSMQDGEDPSQASFVITSSEVIVQVESA